MTQQRFLLRSVLLLGVTVLMADASDTAVAQSARRERTFASAPRRAQATPPGGANPGAPANNGGTPNARGNTGAPAGGAANPNAVVIESGRSYVPEIAIVVVLMGGVLWAVCKSAHRV